MGERLSQQCLDNGRDEWSLKFPASQKGAADGRPVSGPVVLKRELMGMIIGLLLAAP